MIYEIIIRCHDKRHANIRRALIFGNKFARMLVSSPRLRNIVDIVDTRLPLLFPLVSFHRAARAEKFGRYT